MDYTSILRYLETVTATTADYILINTGGNNKKITLNNFITTLGLGGGGVGGGITKINGLTAAIQTIVTGSTGTDFNIVSLGSGHTLNIPSSSATNRGLLTSTDWNTFNSKQDAITLTTTGTSGAATLIGATLNIPQYSSAGSSWQLAGNAPAAGSFLGTTNSVPLQFKRGSNQAGLLGDGKTNAFYGVEAGKSITTGTANTAIGDRSMRGTTDGFSNTALGVDSLLSNTSGYQNTAIGYHNQLSTTTGYDNVSVGHDTMYSNTSGSKNTAIGRRALQSNSSGGNNTVVGYDALFSSTGSGNVAIGHSAANLGDYSNKLFIDNQPRGTSANELTKSLIVGTFDSDPNNQNVTLNSGLKLPYIPHSNQTHILAYNGTTKEVTFQNLPSLSYTIPSLKLKIGKFDDTLKTNPISVAYYDSFNTDWKNYNPEVWLFRLTNHNYKMLPGHIRKRRPRAFRHPSDIDWGLKDPIYNELGTRIYSGGNAYQHTEWAILNTDTSYQNISSFNFNVFEFYDIDASGYPCAFDGWGRPKGRGRGRRKQKVVHFLFRIVIRNPNNPNQVIFGAATNVLKASPTTQGVIMSELMFNKVSFL